MEMVSLSCSFQPPVLCPWETGGLGQMHASTRVGFAFSSMHCCIRPHGLAPACAHLGSLCVELSMQDMLSGSRGLGKYP